MVGAVIDIRVSTKEQTENLSLSTQLRACEEYCSREGFEVLHRFKEEGESAKTADRTELKRLLTFSRRNSRSNKKTGVAFAKGKAIPGMTVAKIAVRDSR